MEVLHCPQCGCYVATTHRFCGHCGSKLPPNSNLEQAMFEVNMEEAAGITEEIEQEPCNDGYHAQLANLVKIAYQTCRKLGGTPHPITHCRECGQELPK